MDFNFKGFRDKLAAHVDSSKEALRKSTASPKQSLTNVFTPGDLPLQRTRKPSDASSVASDVVGTSSSMDPNTSGGPEKFSREQSNSVQNLSAMSSSLLSINSIAENEHGSSTPIFSTPRNFNNSYYSDESASEAGSIVSHPSLTPAIISESSDQVSVLSPSSRTSSANQNSGEIIPMPNDEEIEIQKTQILANYTTDQIVSAFIKNKVRLQNYKTTLRKSKMQGEELNKDNHKLTQLLETTQDKYMRKISEMKEASQLDREAKAHLEKVLQDDLDEKTMIIESLNQKISLLKSGRKTTSEENIDTLMSQHDDLQKSVEILKVYEKFCKNLQHSFDEFSVQEFESSPNILSESLAKNYVQLVKTMTDQCENGNHFDDNQIQNSLEKEAKLNEVYAKCYQLSAILDKEKESLQGNDERFADLINENNSLKEQLTQKSEIAEKSEQDLKLFIEKHQSLVEQQNSTKLECENFSNQVREIEQKWSESENHGKDLENEVESLKNQIVLYQASASSDSKQAAESVQKLTQDLTEFRAKYEDILRQKEDLENRLCEAQSRVQSLEKSKLLVEESLNSKLKETEDDFNGKLREMTQKSEVLETEKSKIVADLEQQVVKTEDFENQNEALKAELKSLEAEKSELKTKLNELEAANTNLNGTKCELESKFEQLNSELQSNLTKLLDLQSEIDAEKVTSSKLESEIESLTHSKVSLETELSSKNSELEILQKIKSEIGDTQNPTYENGNMIEEESISVVEENKIESSSSEVLESIPEKSSKLTRSKSTEEATQTETESAFIDCNRISCTNEKCELRADVTSANARIEELLGKIESLSYSKYSEGKLTSRIDELLAEKETLETTLTSLSKDRDLKVSNLNDKIQELEQELVCKVNEVETLADAVAVSNQNSVSNEEYDNCALENVEIKRNFHQLSNEFDTLREKLSLEKQQAVNDLEIELKDEFNKEKRTLDNEKMELNKELEKLKSEFSAIEESLTSERNRIKDFEVKVDNLQTVVNEQNEVKNKLQALIEQKEMEILSLGKIKDDHSKLLETKTSLESSLDLQAEQFNLERHSFNEKIESLEKAFGEADSNASRVNSLLDEYEKSYEGRIGNLRVELEQQENEVKFLKSSLEDSESRAEELTSSYEDKLKVVNQEKSNLESEIQKLTSDLTSKDAEIENLKKSTSEKAALQTEVSKLKTLLKSRQDEVNDLKQLLDEKKNSETEIQDLTSQLNRKHDEILELKLKMDNNLDVENQLNDLKSEVKSKEQEIVDLKKLASERMSLEGQLNELTFQLKTKQGEIVDLKTSLEEKLSSEILLQKSNSELKSSLDEKEYNLKALQDKLKSAETVNEQQKTKFDDYKKKVEEKFSSQKQIINEKFKVKDKDIEQKQSAIENLESKLKSLLEEKESLISEKSTNVNEIQRLTDELNESHKLINSTLEQSQNDVMLVRHQLESQLNSAKNEIESLKSQLEHETKGKFDELEGKIEELENKLSEKEAKILSYSEDLRASQEMGMKKEILFEDEKQALNKSHFVERNKLAADVKLLQNEKSELEMTLANVKKDYQKYQMKMEESTKRSKEKIEALKSSANEEKLSKDREIKLQADEIAKLRETLQKIRSKHGEEVTEIKSKHTSLVKNLDDQIKENKNLSQKKLESLKRGHEDEISKVLKSHKEEFTQLTFDHEEKVKNILLECEQKSAQTEAEMTKNFNDEIASLRHQLAEKEVTNQSLESKLTDLTSKLQKETLAATLNEYKQKYETLLHTSQNDIKRLEKQHEQKIRTLENKTHEDQRVLDKQVQEQKLIIANLEFEIQDLESNYNAERSRNELLSKEAKSAQKNADWKSLLEAKESEIERIEESMKTSLKSKDEEFEHRLRAERDKIVREMDEFYSEKYHDLVTAQIENQKGQNADNVENSIHINGVSVSEESLKMTTEATLNEPAVLMSPANLSLSSQENLFSLEDPTQLQFLRTILRQFILGQEKLVMAKVLVSIAKFDDRESKEILKAVKQSLKWIPL
ncbi:uncharacterized protein LOC142350680 [Convolutriloba macropyga]|uniref:uncharacterized protein LOC142350680 n=1 Tax=Convolutriloba macropyga TaxID=536237 RepID=UPI003F5260E5